MTSLLLCGIFVVINVILAAIDAHRIKQGKHIYHGVNGAIYGALAIIAVICVHNVFAGVAMLFLRIPVFNTFLNIFRGLPYNYTSKTTTSIVDQATNRLVEKVGYFNYCFIILWIVWVLFCI